MCRWAERRRDDERNEVVQVAERLICLAGPESLVMEQVAMEAGITKSTLYLHFRNKESLCVAVIARIVRSVNSAICQRVAGLRGLRKVRAMSTAVAQYLRDHPEKMSVLNKLRFIRARDQTDENVRELVRLVAENQRILADAIRESCGEGTFIAGIDPLATGQYLHLILQDAWSLPPVSIAALDPDAVRYDGLLKNARNTVYRSMLTCPHN